MMEAASQPTWALVPSLAENPACPHVPTPGRCLQGQNVGQLGSSRGTGGTWQAGSSHVW